MNKRWALNIIAPLAAILFSLVISAIVLLAAGHNPLSAFAEMIKHGVFNERDGLRMDSLVSAINRAVPLYVSAVAVAIGFKMGLFNIGVEGQYQIAALLAASFGAAIALPGPLHVLAIMLLAMAVGAIWSGIAGSFKSGIPWLGVKGPGVHEVISTIMLNGIAVGIGAFLLQNHLRDPDGGQAIPTPELADSGQFPALNNVIKFFDDIFGFVDLDPGRQQLRGFLVVAIIIGIFYYVLINRTRFGFDLRASGLNPGAARASGIDPDKMVVTTMVLSGAVAGLVGMSELLSFSHKYTIDFPTFLGFNGIAVALLGRNHPVGMAAGAFLFGWFDRSAQVLDLRDIPKEIVRIILGVIILSVVVAYAVVGRVIQAREVQAAGVAAAGLSAVEEPGGIRDE